MEDENATSCGIPGAGDEAPESAVSTEAAARLPDHPKYVGFGEACGLWWNNLFNFEGRSTRSEYWWATLVYIIAVLALTVGFILLLGEMGAANRREHSSFMAGSGVLLAFILIVYFVIAASALALRVRRFHDAGFSGWFVLLDFLPYGSVVTFVFSILPSQKKNNKYGPSPENLAKMLSGELPLDSYFGNEENKDINQNRQSQKQVGPYVDTQFISDDEFSQGDSDDMAGSQCIVRKNNWDNNDGGLTPGGDPSEYD